MNEHLSTALGSQPTGELTYIVQLESTTSTLHTSHLTLAEADDPERLATDIAVAYKKHVKPSKRMMYRGILLKKPAVSIVALPGVADPSFVTGAGHHLLIQDKVHDAMLLAAIQDPSILRNVGREGFYGQYKNVFARPSESVPQCAILVHQVNDPTASKVIGIAGSVLSITLGLVSAFVL